MAQANIKIDLEAVAASIDKMREDMDGFTRAIAATRIALGSIMEDDDVDFVYCGRTTELVIIEDIGLPNGRYEVHALKSGGLLSHLNNWPWPYFDLDVTLGSPVDCPACWEIELEYGYYIEETPPWPTKYVSATRLDRHLDGGVYLSIQVLSGKPAQLAL